jgi:lactobin A/cerein 7B family class IIb bacteriocin
MRELTSTEVSEVSGGIFPIVAGIVMADLALHAVFIGYAQYAAANHYAEFSPR